MTLFFTILGLTLSLYCISYFYENFRYARAYSLVIYNSIGMGFWLAIGWLATYQFLLMM